MCKDANSDILKQSLLKMIYSEPGGVPEYLYIDNGKDYTAKTMTGRDRNDRSGMNFDNETMGFYKSIGIKDDHRALPYEPWSKGQIERFFRTVCNKFTRWMKSYTGTLTGSKTSDKVDKDIKRMLVSDDECWLQDIKNEAMTEEGELFYEDEEGDASYGWSLLDFMQGEYDDFTQMEIQQRIRSKMSKRDYIDAGSIQTTVNFDGHIYHIRIAFRRTDSNSEYNIDIESNGVEVIVE